MKLPFEEESDTSVKVDVTVKDGGMKLIRILTPDFDWQSGNADIDVKVHGQPGDIALEGGMHISKATVSSPFLKYPMTNVAASVNLADNNVEVWLTMKRRKKADLARDRTWNLWFRRPTPYPLGHKVLYTDKLFSAYSYILHFALYSGHLSSVSSHLESHGVHVWPEPRYTFAVAPSSVMLKKVCAAAGRECRGQGGKKRLHKDQRGAAHVLSASEAGCRKAARWEEEEH